MDFLSPKHPGSLDSLIGEGIGEIAYEWKFEKFGPPDRHCEGGGENFAQWTKSKNVVPNSPILGIHENLHNEWEN
jgi:hypothetical protein